MHPLIAHLKGKLIVSVQAYPGEPMRHPETMAQIARAAEIGGAAAIRCQGLSDISAIKGRVDVPVIGLWKEATRACTSRRRCATLAPASWPVPTSSPWTRRAARASMA